MGKYKIKLARIEAVSAARVRVTFQIDRGPIAFQVPIVLSVGDFDDTEMVQAARNTLHRTFVELAAQSKRPDRRPSKSVFTDGQLSDETMHTVAPRDITCLGALLPCGGSVLETEYASVTPANNRI